MVDNATLETGATLAVVFAKALFDVRGGHRRDRNHSAAIALRFAELEVSLTQRFAELAEAIAEVRAFVVGPDGKNGMRSEIGDLRRRADDSDRRERNRLEAGHVGSYRPPERQ